MTTANTEPARCFISSFPQKYPSETWEQEAESAVWKWVWVFPETCPGSDIQEASKCQGRLRARRYTHKISSFLLVGMSHPWQKWRWRYIPEADGEEASLLLWTSDGWPTGILQHEFNTSKQLKKFWLLVLSCAWCSHCFCVLLEHFFCQSVRLMPVTSHESHLPWAFWVSEENERKIEDLLKLANFYF